ncbi:MAG: aldose epimerase family protein [Balneolaceae bacterium]
MAAIACFAGTLLIGCSENKQEHAESPSNTEEFGTMEDGRKVQLFTLTNSNGMEVKITNYGGTVTSINVPDADGNFDNVVLGFDDLDKYLAGTPFFGAIIGRYGNRIAEGAFSMDGETYQLATNDGENHLHGGEKGYDKVLWTAKSSTGNSLVLTYLSEDGEEGYPGNLEIMVTYSLTDDNELKIDYFAETDKPTPVNLTNHSYFNLSGDPSTKILDHELLIKADHYTPVNNQLIPTGEIAKVEGTPFDFTEPHLIGERIADVDGGYDHNYVLNDHDGELKQVATLFDPETKRELEVLTTEPGLQFYSGNFLDGSLNGPDGTAFVKYSALCLETQHFPDSPNQPEFPSTILQPGDTYETVTIYRFSVRQ